MAREQPFNGTTWASFVEYPDRREHDTDVSNKVRPNPDCPSGRRLHRRFDEGHSNNPVGDSRKVNLAWNRLACIDCTDRPCDVGVDIGKAFEITLGVSGRNAGHPRRSWASRRRTPRTHWRDASSGECSNVLGSA